MGCLLTIMPYREEIFQNELDKRRRSGSIKQISFEKKRLQLLTIKTIRNANNNGSVRRFENKTTFERSPFVQRAHEPRAGPLELIELSACRYRGGFFFFPEKSESRVPGRLHRYYYPYANSRNTFYSYELINVNLNDCRFARTKE